MKGLAKKVAASTLALVLVIAMGTQCFAAEWGSYFGQNVGWYEGALGSLSSPKAASWTANLEQVGYGGVWGAQIFHGHDAKNNKNYGTVSVKKGQKWTLSFSMKSSNCDKWIYVKVSTGETLAFADWIQLKRGKTVNYSKTFTAKANANSVYFGLGGDFGDRVGVATDPDAATRYKLLPNYAAVLASDANHDPTFATKITCSKFSLVPAKTTLKSVKGAKGKKVSVKYAKANGVNGYQIQYSTKSSMKSAKTKTVSKASKTSYTLTKLKKGKKYYVRVRTYVKVGKKNVYSAWSNKKSAKAK